MPKFLNPCLSRVDALSRMTLPWVAAGLETGFLKLASLQNIQLGESPPPGNKNDDPKEWSVE